MALNIIGLPGSSLPLGIANWRAKRNTPDTRMADPTWDTAFTTKFSKKPDPAAPPVVPMGAAKVIANFIARVEGASAIQTAESRRQELEYLTDTQHLELATTRQELAANGLASVSTSSAPEGATPADLADVDYNLSRQETRDVIVDYMARYHPAVEMTTSEVDLLVGTALANLANTNRTITQFTPDPLYIAQMSRRIEWERYMYACGPVHRVAFGVNKAGEVTINYSGPSKDPEFQMAMRRHLKYEINGGTLPTPEAIRDFQAFNTYYQKPVLAHMTPADHEADRLSRRAGSEEPDPERQGFSGEMDPKPIRDNYPWEPFCNPPPQLDDCGHNECLAKGWTEYNEDTKAWSARNPDIGYAGPAGLLGTDVDSLTEENDLEPYA